MNRDNDVVQGGRGDAAKDVRVIEDSRLQLRVDGEGSSTRNKPSHGGPRLWALKFGAAAVGGLAVVAAGTAYGIHRYRAELPNFPSSITVTKYTTFQSRRADVSTYTLTGAQMQALYRGIRRAVSHHSPRGIHTCEAYVESSAQYTAVTWTYNVVVNYLVHPPRSFKQTYDGCVYVKDEQTGTTHWFGGITDRLPGLMPVTFKKNS